MLYINDVNYVFDKAITIHFADKTHLSYASKKLITSESVINYELKKIAEWLKSNKLSLHSGKSKFAFVFTQNQKSTTSNNNQNQQA